MPIPPLPFTIPHLHANQPWEVAGLVEALYRDLYRFVYDIIAYFWKIRGQDSSQRIRKRISARS